jgi:hypothetical protein
VVCARERPPWLVAVMTELDIEATTVAQAVNWYARSESA